MGSQSHEIARKIGALEQRVAATPRDSEGWYELSSAWLGLEHTDRASACVDRLIELECDATRTMIARAELLTSQENYGMAELLAERAVRAEPDSAQAQLCLAAVAGATRQIGPAISALRRALELRPTDGDIALSLARSLRTLGRVEEALDLEDASMERALAGDDRETIRRCVDGIGTTLMEPTRTEFALLKQRMPRTPDRLALRMRWQVCVRDPNCKASKLEARDHAWMEDLIRKRPDLPGLSGLLSLSPLADNGERFARSAAGRALDEVLRARPDDLNVAVEAAQIYIHVKRDADAERLLARASRLDPAESRWPAMRAVLMLGDAQSPGRVERVSSSIEHLERAAGLERLPKGDAPELGLALAYACCASGRLDQAEQWFERFLRSNVPRRKSEVRGELHVQHTIRGLIAFARGDREVARGSLLDSVKIPLPGVLDVLWIETELAESFLRAGEKDLVREFLTRAIRIANEMEQESLREDRLVTEQGRVPIGWQPMNMPFHLLGRY